MWGAKGVVCGPEGARLADNCVTTKPGKCHLFLPSPIHACPRHGPWAKRVPDVSVRGGQLRETTLTENIGLPGLLGFGRGADNHTPTKKYCYEI